MHIFFVLLNNLDFLFVMSNEISQPELYDRLCVHVLTFYAFLVLVFSVILFACMYKWLFKRINLILIISNLIFIQFSIFNNLLFHFLNIVFLNFYQYSFLLNILIRFMNFLIQKFKFFSLSLLIFSKLINFWFKPIIFSQRLIIRINNLIQCAFKRTYFSF